MKNILFLMSITVLGLSVNLQAQAILDSNGNLIDKNVDGTSLKSSPGSAKTTSSPPIIINTIQSPTSYVSDIAFDGENLWVEGYSEFVLFKISPVDGAVLKTIYTNITRPYGLEFANGNLWVADADNHLIQQVDTSNGNVISTFPTPCVSGYPQGLAWDGQNLWNNDAMATSGNPNDSTYKITTTGQLLEAHHAFGTYVTGLAWDGQYLWSSDNPNQHIYKINTSSFTVIDTVDAPGGQFPNGLAFDGQYLWVSNNDTDSIYQIDISNTNTGISQDALTNKLGFSIYPNPATDEITIELSGSKAGSTYSIFDQTGKKILNGKLNDESTIVDIKNLTEGIYLFQVGEKQMQSFKVIKK